MTNQQINYWALQETKRHDIAQEELGRNTLKETSRHNVVSEGLGFMNLDEQRRHSIVTENETRRHDLATEYVAQQQLGLGFAQLAETRRRNTNDYIIGIGNVNVARKNAETNAYNAQTSRLNYNETVRHDDVTEKLHGVDTMVDIGSSLLRIGTRI